MSNLADSLATVIGELGTTEATEASYAIDVNSTILADPYLTGTGWFPDKVAAIRAADALLPIVREIARAHLTQYPSAGDGWTDPAREAATPYVTLVSAARNEWDEPVEAEDYYGI